MRHPVTCGIVAGGASSRMGRPKALLPFRGRPLLARQISLLDPLFARVLVAANGDDSLSSFGAEIVPDVLGERCALTAVHAVLAASRTEHAFVVACDLPFLNPRLVEHLVEQRDGWDVVVPSAAGSREPLHAVYSRGCLPAIEEAARRGEWKVDRFYRSVRTREIEIPVEDWLVEGRSPFFNANTPAEWDSAAP